MFILPVTDCNGKVHNCPVYRWKELPIKKELLGIPIVGNRDKKYYNIPCAFDIETTSVDKENAHMYIWQFCIGNSVCMGRTWEEFKLLIKELIAYTSHGVKFLIWCHNLSFEFQFMKHLLEVTKVFARDTRSPISVRCEGIEFRCSYYLTNMSLDMLLKNTPGALFWKKTGTFDYSILRYPWTELTQLELEYCYCDVRGLCEAIYAKLKDDTLSTIPLTSTGYVRRHFREVCQSDKECMQTFANLQLTEQQYRLCRKAMRGGDTGANYLYATHILEDVTSYDLKSSYPASMLIDKFPMTAFTQVKIVTVDKLNKCLENKACLFTFTAKTIKVKMNGVHPYIDKAHCERIIDGRFDNGRVLSAKLITMTVTDVDWSIITEEYKFDGLVINELYIASYDYLPMKFRQELLTMFKEKCRLEYQYKVENKKDVKEVYDKFKNKINAAYGMIVTDIMNPEVVYEDGKWKEYETEVSEALDKYYNSSSSFLSYQHGVWVTANARKRLRTMKHIVGIDDVYDDTDSIKFIGEHEEEFTRMNEEIEKLYEQSGLDIIYEYKDIVYKIGQWDYDGHYEKFVTMGAKKYCVVENGELEITIAGCGKKIGSKYLSEHGGIESFKVDFEFPIGHSGRNTAYYNDSIVRIIETIHGTYETGSNISMFPTSYILGITDEYEDLLKGENSC